MDKSPQAIPLKMVSPLEKCFSTHPLSQYPCYEKASVLRGERFGFQAIWQGNSSQDGYLRYVKVGVESPLDAVISLSLVEEVPVHLAAYPGRHDNGYLSLEPGLYPDLLTPLDRENRLPALSHRLTCVWVDIQVPEDMEPGSYPIALYLNDQQGTRLASQTFTLEVLPASLPPQALQVTQWFHCDCIAQWYEVPVFSEKHWAYLENYIQTAVKNGMNTILTPVFTPPLDTQVGGERLTVQLVEITREGGNYTFSFEKLDRWVRLCEKAGIQKFEIAHFFTQWGAKHAPKIMAWENGVEKQIFGWETDAAGEEYRAFLKSFVPALLSHFQELGVGEDRLMFHISDEPGKDQLESYQQAKAGLAPLLPPGCQIFDALSHVSFYDSGAVENPIPASNHIGPFLEREIRDLWTYYCCSQCQKVSNRFMAMPSSRNRILGTQLYIRQIKGFLHWGYNFWNNQYSQRPINPFLCTDAEYFVPAGDPFLVYPGKEGQPLESLRLLVFAQGLSDLRAMNYCEFLVGREQVLALIRETLGQEITEGDTFDQSDFPAGTLLALREKVNRTIAQALSV